MPETHGPFGLGLLMDKGMGVMEKKGWSLMIDSSYKVKLYCPGGIQVGIGQFKCLTVLPGSWVNKPGPVDTVRFTCDWNDTRNKSSPENPVARPEPGVEAAGDSRPSPDTSIAMLRLPPASS